MRIREIPLPRVEVLDVDRQEGDIAVQADPAYDVEAADLTGCETMLLGRLFGWLNPNQREAARVALHYSGSDYAGKLRLKPRTPDVVCDTISNVCVTDRALLETILLDFNVTRAGVRRLEFLLPEEMADSRISVPLLLQKPDISPAGEKHPGMVRVRLDLQEDVMGQIRVKVENDRLLTAGAHQVPIPMILNARVNRRYAVIENTSRAEVVVEQKRLRGMDVLGRQGKDWAVLKGFLGDKITMAYLVSPDAERPQLSFEAVSHEALKTVQASIGLSQTTLVVDSNGAYRAAVTLRVNNETEQYLDVQLPEGAKLWTARVAGEPVKPTQVPGGEGKAPDPRGVRIPLIKTALGDLAFPVVLRYGGKMPSLDKVGVARFPMIRCLNITPQLSNVTLYLPERYRWFDFGGTMRRTDTAEQDAGVVQYWNKQVTQIGTALREGDAYAKARASNSLSQMPSQRPSIGSLASQVGEQSKSQAALETALNQNAGIMEKTYQEAERQQQTVAQTLPEDNRQRLEEAYRGQTVNPSKNVVGDLGRNWGTPHLDKLPYINKASKGTGIGRETQSLIMMVTPRIIIQEEEEEKLGIQGESKQVVTGGKFSEKDSSRPDVAGASEATLGVSGIRGSQTQGRDYNRQSPQSGEAENLSRYQRQLAGQTTTTTDATRGYLQSSAPSGRSDFDSRTDLTTSNVKPSTWPEKKPARSEPAPDHRYLIATTAPKPSSATTPDSVEKPAAPQATGLASLDFELPLTVDGSARGVVYNFTAPLGEQQITARYVSGGIVRGLIELAIVLVAFIVAWLIVAAAFRGGFDWLARPAGSWLLICLGLLSLIGGVFPWAGLALFVVGLWLKMRWLAVKPSVK